MPEFQFLTTNNPEDFKKGLYLRQIRSHAMLSVKHAEQKPRKRRKPAKVPRTGCSLTATSGFNASASSSPLGNALLNVERPIEFVGCRPATNTAEKVPRKWRMQDRYADGGDDYDNDYDNDYDDDYNDDYNSNNNTASDHNMVIVPRKLAKASSALFAPYVHVELAPRQVGRGADVLNTMPEFSNPGISVWDLKRRFDHLMVTDTMRDVYFPAMDGCRHAFLSTACIKATYSDMLSGYVGQSSVTLSIKEEVYAMIRHSFPDPKARVDDGMFMCIGHLLAAELVTGEEGVMMVHEQGLDGIAEQRGGLERYGGGGVIANAISSPVLLSAIVREGQPSQRFLDYSRRPAVTPCSAHLAESPLFCPRNDFSTIIAMCSPGTLYILRNMRDMTDLLLKSEKSVRQHTLRNHHPYPPQLSTHLWSFHMRMVNLLPNTDPSTFFHLRSGTPGVDGPDFVYEACRYAAVLYSYAIAARVPMSVAGQHFKGQCPRLAVLADPSMSVQYSFNSSSNTPSASTALPSSSTPSNPSLASSPLSSSSASLSCTHPSIAILTAIEQTPDAHDAWGDLIGVLFWVSTVATVAARAQPPFVLSCVGQHYDGCSCSNPQVSSSPPDCLPAFPSTHQSPTLPTSSYSSPTGNTPSPGPSAGGLYDYDQAIARKRLAMTALLCIIKLAFEQPASMFPAAQTMLRVQALLEPENHEQHSLSASPLSESAKDKERMQ